MEGWKFPLTNGGQEDGFNDPGVNIFAGDFEKYVAREAIQNVLDAKRAEQENVRIRFELSQIASSKVPGHSELTQIMAACYAYDQDDVKAKAFFDNAANLLKKDKLTVLSIRDYNTTGLIGTDEDNRSNWYSMIRSVGSSHKSNDAGGSFGIGKNAPFAASALRVVFYSTKLEGGQVAFQGVARLVTHLDATKEPTQGTGYYGLVDEKGHPKSIREESKIPLFFRRQEQGTDIHILGYLGSDHWTQLLERATLEHFWPAISWGHLVVEIGDSLVINKEELPQRMEAARSEALANNPYYTGFNEAAYVYYDAYTSHQHEETETLKRLKEVKAYFKTGEADLPNQVAMIRKTGMVIYKHGSFRGLRLKFAGVFVCDNKEGNELLRQMEPPKHDEWEVDRPAKGAGRSIKKEYHDWLRGTLVSLTPKIETDVLAVDELADYLPDTISPDGNASKNRPTEDNALGNTQEANEISEPVITETVGPTAKKPAPNPDDKPKPPTDDPDPQEEEEDSTDKDTDDEEEEKPKKKVPAVLQAKGFADAKAGEYIVVLRSTQPTTMTVTITAVGEDAFTEEVSLLSARDQETKDAIPVGGNKIEQIELQANQARRLAIAFNDFARRAVNITAYEV